MDQSREAYFKEIYQSHKNKIYRLCMGFTGNAADADDLFQEIQVKIWYSLPNFRGDSQIGTWIYRIASNTAIRFVNKQRKIEQMPLQPGLEATSFVENSTQEWEEKTSRLYRSISQLPELDRIIISLVLEGNAYQEIAAITDLTINHIGVKINRIKKALKKLMEHE